MRRLLVLLVVVVPLGIAAVGAAAPEARQATLTGQVVVRGVGLGCLREPCWKPMPSVPVTILRREAVVSRALSDADGRFRVALAPGVYTVRAPGLVTLAPGPVPQRSNELRATLRAGQLTRVTLVIFEWPVGKTGSGRL